MISPISIELKAIRTGYDKQSSVLCESKAVSLVSFVGGGIRHVYVVAVIWHSQAHACAKGARCGLATPDTEHRQQ